MSLISDVSIALTSLNTWVDVLQGNIEGTRRTGFKGNRISFASQVIEYPQKAHRLESVTSAALTVTQTSPDMTQGPIAFSHEASHLAIEGTGFFMLSDQVTSDPRFYYTRDGEFTWDGDGFLRNQDGLYVMDSTAATDATRCANAVPWSGTFSGDSFAYRELVRFDNTLLTSLVAGDEVGVTLNTNSLISDGMMQNNANDLHVVYWNGNQLTEVASQLVGFPSGSTEVRFQLQQGLAKDASAENYFIYFGSNASPLPARTNGVIAAPQLYGDRVSRNGAIMRGSESHLAERVGVANLQNEYGVKFSKYGATVYEIGDGRFTQLTSASTLVGLVSSNALEGSNTSFSAYLPILMHVQRMYAALTKLITLHNQTIDDVIAISR